MSAFRLLASSPSVSLSATITAIGNNLSRPTSGTEALACTASGGVGSVTYAWTVTDPSGASVTPADATAASTTIAYTPSQLPGQWTAVMVVTDAAGRTARAVEVWTTGGMPTASSAYAIMGYVTGGALVWKEQVEIGSEWVDVAGSSGSFAVGTNGGVTFSGTTMTIPSGIATNTATQSCADERYMELSSASAALQALIATGATCSIQVSEGGMEMTANARWGVAVVSTAGGAFDASSENRVSTRIGWNGSAWQLAVQANTAAFASVGTAATMGTRSASFSCGQSAGYWYWDAGTVGGALTTGTALPDRVYITASATTSTPAADTDVTNPRVRVIFRPVGTV